MCLKGDLLVAMLPEQMTHKSFETACDYESQKTTIRRIQGQYKVLVHSSNSITPRHPANVHSIYIKFDEMNEFLKINQIRCEDPNQRLQVIDIYGQADTVRFPYVDDRKVGDVATHRGEYLQVIRI
jgi:hypothetical protein